MHRLRQLITSKAFRSRLRYAGAGILSAALLVLSFPRYSIWGLTFIGLVPFFLALFRARDFRDVFWMGFACTTLFILLGFGWISFVATNFGGLPWIVGKIILVLFSLFGELQFLLFALLAYGLLLRLGRVRNPAMRSALAFIGLPSVYVGLDFLYPKIFPNTLGHVLYNWFSVVQIVEYTGVSGLTFPIVVTNLALAVLIESVWRKKKAEPYQNAFAGAPRGFAAAVALVLVGLGFSWTSHWGAARIRELQTLEQGFLRTFRFSIIQANIGDVDKLASERGYEPAVQKVLATYRSMSLAAVERFNPDLVIWPETAYPFLYTHLENYAANQNGMARDQWVAEFMRELKVPLYFGTYSMIGKRDFNSAYLVDPAHRKLGVYYKSVLLAFGEYVPLGPFSSIVQDLVPAIANFGRGRGPTVIDLKGVKLGPQICYEGIFPEHSRESSRLGAELLLNITNDSWFGDTGEPWLHLLLTAFRSIELRRPLARATNTGVSTVVEFTGEMRQRTKLFEPETLDAEVKLPGSGQTYPETFYQRHGELFASICTVIALIFVGWGLLPTVIARAKARLPKKARSAGRV